MYLHGSSAATPSKGAPTPGQQPQSGGISAFLTGLTQNLGTALQIYNQQRLAQENLRRIRQGMQPIDYSDIPGLVPTVQVEAGIAPQTQTTAMLLFGGLGLLAFLALSKGRRKR